MGRIRLSKGRKQQVWGVPRGFEPVLRLWMLRMLVPLGGQQELFRSRGGIEADILRLAGLRVKPGSELEPEVLRPRLVEAHRRAEAACASLPQGCSLVKNLQWVADRVGLTAVEQTLLGFVLLAELDPRLARMIESLGNLSAPALERVLSCVLGVPGRAVRLALDEGGTLARSGLLTLDLRNRWSFENKLSTLPGAQRLLRPMVDRERLFVENFLPAPPPTLAVDDYRHLQEDLRILEACLAEALASRRKGLNVLLYGPPGTGKTELARVLAGSLGARLFEVATEDAEGKPVPGRHRIRAFQLSQALLAQHPGRLILLDEIEDVFHSDNPFETRGKGAGGQKAWMNRLLETNPVPSFWISNTLSVLDHALIRRFDYVLELGVPPRRARERILAETVGDLGLPPGLTRQLVAHDRLAPALLARAGGVARRLQPCLQDVDPSSILERALGNTLQALGTPLLPAGLTESTPEYRTDVLNADRDLETLLAGLRVSGSGRLCLYGPPGTGKSAFGRHLAEVLDRPLVVRRASDLLSPFVGMTERLLSEAFREAATERAVLLLDEADSFLQDRSEATRTWETTQVNEMLTQIEAFQGVLVTTTNLMDRLDPAVLRRFDLRIRFGYLKPEQAWILFQETAHTLGIPVEDRLQPTLSRLAVLTPGDFATVRRQGRLQPVRSAGDLLERLQIECAAKREGRRMPLGFTG